MVSAKQKTIDRKMGYLVGIDDYMSKPVDEEEFILKIKALLRRAKINDERKIRIGDVVLDYDSFTVSRKDEVVELPKKEFELLYKLLSYP
ncbi:response regulator transcription factor, partial [Thomasclavelia spiroformis]|uniref:response regulator transcription factor n=2 Tax=Thomasclavelia TaxID=3025755 RepID=UPI003D189173